MVATETRSERTTRPGAIGATITDLLGGEVPVRIDAYDGSSVGPSDAGTRLVVRSPDALALHASPRPASSGSRARTWRASSTSTATSSTCSRCATTCPNVKLGASRVARARARSSGLDGLRPLRLPPEEARLHGRRHSKERDAAAIAHHYDVSNDFYRMVLGPSMTYSCAVWPSPDATLEDAQATKYELVCRKLGLRPGHAAARRRLRLGRHGACTRRGTTACTRSA